MAVEGMLFSVIPTYKISYSALTMVVKIFVTVAVLQLNLLAKSICPQLSLSFMRVRRN